MSIFSSLGNKCGRSIAVRGLLFMIAFAAVGAFAQDSCPRTWMREGKYGVSTHFFGTSPNDLDQIATELNVNALADQAAGAGAAWFIFTLQHQNWLLMAPNKEFDRIVGNSKYTARRDVPAELVNALRKHNIRMMLYVNIRLDPESGAAAEVRRAMGAWPPDDRLIDNIAAVYREYSLRYGTDVSGWWVDSAGLAEFSRSPRKEIWFQKLAAAMRAGNPNAMVAFSPGIRVDRYSRYSDYTAGETTNMSPLPAGPCVEGAQWHTWVYLGGFWGSDGTRYSDRDVCRYVTDVAAHGGSVTFDLGTWGVRREGLKGRREEVRQPGTIDPAQVRQLNPLRSRLAAAARGEPACN